MLTTRSTNTSLYSRTFPLLLMGIDTGLWISTYVGLSYFGFEAYVPDFPFYLVLICLLSWCALTLWLNCYQAHYHNTTQIGYYTLAISIRHSIFVMALGVLGPWSVFMLACLIVSVSFYVIRIFAFMLLNKLIDFWKTQTSSKDRFIIIGEANASQPLRNYLQQNGAEFAGYVDVKDVSTISYSQADLLSICQRLRVTHIYCTLSLPEGSSYLRELLQLADHAFIYFHLVATPVTKKQRKPWPELQIRWLPQGAGSTPQIKATTDASLPAVSQ